MDLHESSCILEMIEIWLELAIAVPTMPTSDLWGLRRRASRYRIAVHCSEPFLECCRSRAAAAEVVQSLMAAVSQPQLERLYGFALAWLSGTDGRLGRAACQVKLRIRL